MVKYSGEILAGVSALVLDFNKPDYDVAKASDKLIVLYFYANWCPICRLEFPVMQSAFNELTTDKVIGFRVNYNDSDTDADEKNLARAFGIPYQHTKVFLKKGTQILKAPDSWSKDRYLSEINKAIAR
ncbi:redoxin domain-containing protein [Candidatus Azambacteria bacterium]|nr:redoxin domain-containing protein [Candidatus Azambacteria bacterium]